MPKIYTLEQYHAELRRAEVNLKRRVVECEIMIANSKSGSFRQIGSQISMSKCKLRLAALREGTITYAQVAYWARIYPEKSVILPFEP